MSAAPLKILVVDDEPPIRKLLRMGLATQGYAVLEAPDARSALALLGLDRVRFTAPVKFGDTLHTEMTVKQARESSKPDRGVVTFDVTVKNQRAEVVCTYETSVLMRRRV